MVFQFKMQLSPNDESIGFFNVKAKFLTNEDSEITGISYFKPTSSFATDILPALKLISPEYYLLIESETANQLNHFLETTNKF